MQTIEMNPAITELKLSPSNIRWLFDRCPRCFWLNTRDVKLKEKFEFGLANIVDRSMKASLGVEELRKLGIPAKQVLQRGNLKSKPIVTTHGVTITINGKLDKSVELDSGSTAVIEFKMSEPTPKAGGRDTYADQVNAYAYCLENPADDETEHVEAAYCIYFSPRSERAFTLSEDGNYAAVRGGLAVREIEITRGDFLDRLDQIAAVAALHEMPDAGNWCETCRHVDRIVEMRTEWASDVARTQGDRRP